MKDVNLFLVKDGDKEIFCSCKDSLYFSEVKFPLGQNIVGLYFSKKENYTEELISKIKSEFINLLKDQRKVSMELQKKNTIDLKIDDISYQFSFTKHGHMIDVGEVVVTVLG